MIRASSDKTGRSHSGPWTRGLVWVAGAAGVSGLVWFLTGADVLFACVVALVALGALDQRPVRLRRALVHLGAAAALAVLGAATFARWGIGLGPVPRMAQAAVGLSVAAVVLAVVAASERGRRRGRSRP